MKTNPEDNIKDGNGYYIDPNSDYLAPIPKSEIGLDRQKAHVELIQNYGWF